MEIEHRDLPTGSGNDEMSLGEITISLIIDDAFDTGNWTGGSNTSNSIIANRSRALVTPNPSLIE